MENASDVIFTYDLSGRFTYVNAAAVRISGYTREEILKLNFTDLVAPEYHDLVRERLQARRDGHPLPSRYPLEIVHRDGTRFAVEISTQPILQAGKAIGVQGIARDVTDRKHAEEEKKHHEEALHLQKAYLEQLFESAPEGIVVQDNQGRVARANCEFCRMFGYTAEDITGQVLDDLIAHDENHDEAAALTHYSANGGRFSIETVRRRKDGSPVEVSILGTPVQVAGGQVAVYVIYRDITERKRAEQALIESEAKFRAVADTAAAAIYIHTDNRFLFVNRASEAISGYTRDELLAMSPFALAHPDHREMLRERAAARERGEPVPNRYEFKIITRSGEERWLDFSAGSIQFGGHNATLATAFDITKRKRAEQLQSALYRIAERANEARDLQTLYASIHAIVAELLYAKNFYIALWDKETGLLSWPYFVDEQDTFPPETRPLRRGLTEYVLRTGQPLLASPEVFDQLVTRGEIESIGAPSLDWLGVPLKVAESTFGVLAVQSYTEQVRFNQHQQEILTFVGQHVAAAIEHASSQESIRRSEQRYRSLFERALYGVYRSDLSGHFVAANPALITMLGYESLAEILKLDLDREVYAEPGERKRVLREYHEESRSVHETRWRRKDGKIITVRLSGTLALNRAGEMEGYEVIVEDITERRALEEQLRHAQKMEAVGRLAGGVAHDFNNLLTVIKGYSELLLDQVQEPDPMRAQLDEVRKAADRAATLTRQLLAFSRRQVLAPKVLDLNSIVTNMEKLLRRLLGEDVEFLTILESGLGRVKADPGQVEQVIMNLAVNARDAMPQGGHLIVETSNVTLDDSYQLEHTTVVPGPYVMLAVSDNGGGMTEEIRSRIFEPFFTTKERGTGLGLSTVYGIVKQSEGYVWVYSEIGKGSTFKVYLPRVNDTPELRDLRPPDSSAYRGTETVLVVEDEDGVRTLVQQMLQRQGYTVLATRNGGEALIVCERNQGRIDLLLTDVVLSQLSGPELAKRLLAVRPEMFVLYMSGYTEDAIVNHGVLKPDIAFLQKPFTTESLARKVREVLDLRKA